MAASFLLLLLVSACAAELGFKPKQLYTYDYEAKQSSGIPGLQTQWSAFGMKMKIHIQVGTIGNLYISLKDIKQGELKNVHTHQQWRNISIPYSTIQQHQKSLGNVFKLKMVGGVVRAIITLKDEPTWVVNIKKSIAQLLQIDIWKHHSMDKRSMAQPSAYQTDDSEAMSFRVMEGSIGGECETLYDVTPSLPDNIKANILKGLKLHSNDFVPPPGDFHPFILTKTKNYQNCRSRHNWQHMMAGVASCRADDCYLTASNRSATARYILDGDKDSFRIQSVVAESEALMFPFGHETEQLWTITNQTLFLSSYSSTDSPPTEPVPPKFERTLAFRYPTADDSAPRLPDLKSAPQISTYLPGAPVKLIREQLPPTELVRRVKELIKLLDNSMKLVPDPVKQDVTGYVVDIEHAFSWLSYDELSQVYQELDSQAHDTFWDTLALSGTNPAVMRILHGVANKEIAEKRAASLLATLPTNIKTPTYELVNEIYQTLMKSTVQETEILRRTMALSLGNIFYQVCVSNTTVDHSYSQSLYMGRFCSSNMMRLMREKFIPFLSEHISRSPQLERLPYIQALGNVGDKQIIPILSVLVNEGSRLVASKAIYAFYRVVGQHPEQVRKVMATVFHDVTRPTEVRLAAVTMLLATNPPIAYWQKIAISTWFEPNKAVVAIIHSTYSTLANITMAQVQPLFEMSRRARITLPLIRPPPGGFAFSGSYSTQMGGVIPQYQVAALFRLSLIASPTSVIPSVFYLESQHYINSIISNNHRWDLSVQGGQKIIDDMMGVGNASTSNIGYNDLRSLVEMLNLTKANMEKFQATLYTQLMGATDAFITENDTHHHSWSRTKVQKIAYLEDITVTFASEIGLPVIYSKKTPLVASVNGNMRAEWDDKEGWVSLKSVQPFVAFKSLVVVGTVSPFSLRMLGAGVESKAQLSLPMSCTIKLNTIQAKKLDVEVESLSQPSPVTVAHIRTRPFTTAVLVKELDISTSDNRKITVSKTSVMTVNFTKDFFGITQDFGIAGQLRLAAESPVINFGTFWTELKKRSPVGLTNFWFMVSSLHYRQYDVIIDTANSASKKFNAVFLRDNKSDEFQKVMRMPILTCNPQPIDEAEAHQSARQQMEYESQQQQKTLMMSGVEHWGYAARAYITQQENKHLHYTLKFGGYSDAQWYNYALIFHGQTMANNTCLKARLSIPVLSDTRQTLLDADIKATVQATLTSSSSVCKVCEYHTLKMKGTIRRDDSAKQYAQSCPEALRCEQHEKRDYHNSADCRIAKDHAALANYFDLEFTGQNLTQKFRNSSYSLDFFTKLMFWPYMSNDPYAKNPSNKMSIKIQTKPASNAMSVHIVKPFETTFFEDVPLPFNMLYEPGLLTMRKSISKKISDCLYGVDQTVCIVNKQVVKTFDNVTLDRDNSTCYTVLAIDSSYVRKLAIAERQVNDEHAVYIIVDNHIIQIDSKAFRTVKIDDIITSLDYEHPIIRRSDGKIYAQIIMLTDDNVKVVLPQHLVKVLVTKEGVQITASQLAYRNRMRGICGDMNGEHQDDMVGPQGCLYQSGREFTEAYHVPLFSMPHCSPKKPVYCVHKPTQPGQYAQDSTSGMYEQH